MISRRIIRIKVLQILYSFFKSDSDSMQKAEKELLFSLEKTNELYHYLFLLLIDVVEFASVKIENAKNKNFPTPEELIPNTRFIENPVISQVYENTEFVRYIETKKLTWVNYPELIRNLYTEIIKSDVYKNYMTAEKVTFNDHKNFVIDLCGEFLATNELLGQVLEEKSIYWNDDLEFVLGILTKSVSKMKEGKGKNVSLMQMYKNDEDKQFLIDLFRRSIFNFQDNQKLIHDYTKNWELERIAFMDILLMSQAITEITNFSSIPIKVSMNEYIEIAKYYSTHKSSVFINGVLDKIVDHLKKENKIEKTGRGLIDN